MVEENIIVVDTENGTPTGRPNPDKDILKYIGIRLPNGTKHVFKHPQQMDKCQQIMDRYRYIVGHNWHEYDRPLMERHGYKFSKKTHLDTLEIIKKRAKTMMNIDFSRGQLGLRALCKYFKLEHQKGDFDYKKLNRPFLTPQEYQDLRIYLFGDLDSTYDLFKYLYDFFYGFKELVSDKDRMTFKWLTASSGSTAYKVICNLARLPEEYSDARGDKYPGSFVSAPTQDVVSGYIVVFDFSSLYPNMFMGGNLYSPTPEGFGWNGSEIYKVKGTYARTMGKIETVIKQLFESRQEDKKKMKQYPKDSDEYKLLDKKQYSKKIIVNTAYGISGSPIFKSVYNRTTASDCTAMAKQSILHAREVLQSHGYKCVYTDTDSVYVLDHKNDFKELEALCSAITRKQISNFNIPIESHNFEFEDEIKRMYFFRNDSGQFVKKHYMYVKADNSVVIKGLKPVRGDCSEVARQVFENYIKEDIRNGRETQYYSIDEIRSKIEGVARDNPDVLTKRFRVYNPESYKSQTAIQVIIGKDMGEGEHYLVPNKFIGYGKSTKYATPKKLKEAFGDDWLEAVLIDRFVSDLSEFIKPQERKQIGKRKRKDRQLSEF